MSLICVVDLKSTTAYRIDGQQTIDSEPEKGKQRGYTRIDQYAEHLERVSDKLKKSWNRVYYGRQLLFQGEICKSNIEAGL